MPVWDPYNVGFYLTIKFPATKSKEQANDNAYTMFVKQHGWETGLAGLAVQGRAVCEI